MAKKGQKFKKYSKEIKEVVLRKYFEEYISSRVLSEEYNIPQNTIDTWVYKTQKGQDVLADRRKQNSGRPKKDENNIDYKERYEILKKYQAFLKAQREKK